MPTWSDLTGYVDSVKGQLSPEERRVVESAFNWGFAGDQTERMKAAQRILMKRLGMDDRAAANFLSIENNVRKNGGGSIEADMFSKDKIGSRAEYSSDDEYLTALLGAYNLKYTGSGNSAPYGSAAPGAGGPPVDPINAKIQTFIDSMMGPMDPNDPTAQLIQRSAVNAAQAYAGRAGANARSTIGNSAVVANYNNGMQAYDMQRKALAQQGMGLLNQRDLGLGQLQFGYDQLQQGRDEAQWAAGKNQAQGIGGMIGLGLGTVAAAYTGMPQLAGLGAQGGAALGGLTYGGSGPNYSPLPNYTTSGSGRARGGLGGTGY